MTNTPRNILILSLSGIGNFLMHTPVFAALKQSYPESKITLWAAPRGTKILAHNDSNIDQVLVSPIKRPFPLQMHYMLNLSRHKFDTAFMLSPGQQWKGAANMFLAGIPNRIAHQYPHLGNNTSDFLLTKSMPEKKDLHDIDQNLNLISLIKKTFTHSNTRYHLNIPSTAENKAAAIIAKINRPKKYFVGIHAGSAPDFKWKRWPVNQYLELSQYLVKKHNAHILIFGGPDELALKKQLRTKIGKNQSTIITSDLLTTASVMAHCKLFVSNDSGLMHIAAASGVKTFGLFGPTNEKETGPRGIDSHIIRAPNTKPVYDTETNFDLGQESHDSLLNLTTSQVISSLNIKA